MTRNANWIARLSPQMHFMWQGPWPPGYVEPPRVLYDHELVVVTEGFCIVTIAGCEFSCPENSFIVIPPGRQHASEVASKTNVHRYSIHFDWVFQGRFSGQPFAYLPCLPKKNRIHSAPDFVPRKILHGTVNEIETIGPLLNSMSFNWTSCWGTGKRHKGFLLCQTQLLELLVRLLAPQAPRNIPADHESKLAFLVRDSLGSTAHMGEPIQELLGSLGYSYAHLCRIFRRYFGMTPVQYRNAIRMEKAKQLLKDRSCSVSEVAHELGFNNPSYFTRLFCKYTGRKPSRVKG